jgi:hypothetical protein
MKIPRMDVGVAVAFYRSSRFEGKPSWTGWFGVDDLRKLASLRTYLDRHLFSITEKSEELEPDSKPQS